MLRAILYQTGPKPFSSAEGAMLFTLGVKLCPPTHTQALGFTTVATFLTRGIKNAQAKVNCPEKAMCSAMEEGPSRTDRTTATETRVPL